MKNKLGFTLLELLVVVIIIAILAAIALPKYQLAVDKAEFAKYQSTVSSLVAAYDEYYMTHGVATRKFENLTFTMPSDFKKVYDGTSINCVQNSSMFCCMSNSGSQNSGLINCGKNDLSFIYVQSLFYQNYSNANRRGKCLAAVDDARANRLCNALGTKGGTTNTWTPIEGASDPNTYQNYLLK